MEKSLLSNAASTVVLPPMVKVHVLVELAHPPVNPLKLEPEAGVAVSVTAVPLGKEAEQVAPQSMPAGFEVTVPDPVPDFVTVAAYEGGAPTGLMSNDAYQTDCTAPPYACRPP